MPEDGGRPHSGLLLGVVGLYSVVAYFGGATDAGDRHSDGTRRARKGTHRNIHSRGPIARFGGRMGGRSSIGKLLGWHYVSTVSLAHASSKAAKPKSVVCY